MSLRRFFSKEREIKMIWESLKEGRKSYLVGTAHFFPFSFKISLKRYISKVDIVLVEGALDENAMRMVVEQGLSGEKGSSLYDALSNQTIMKINRELTPYQLLASSLISYLDFLKTTHGDLLYRQIKGQRPWLAFFNIWYQYIKKRGWTYTMDLDAFRIAGQFGKKTYHLEEIEEQIKALSEIPFERIVNFLEKIDHWDKYMHNYVKLYLNGELERLVSVAKDRGFPTYCEAIVDKRDPILYERMKPFLEEGNTIVFVGVSHLPGIKRRLLKDGYTIQPVSS